MVDPIGIKTGTTPAPRAVPAAGTAAAAAVSVAKPVKREPKSVEAGSAALTSTMAAQPPVDADRVARIRKAIADGRFPTLPATIADRLLALKLEWNPNDAA